MSSAGNLSHRRTHNLLLISKLLSLRDTASPLTLVLDSLEQPATPLFKEYIRRAQVATLRKLIYFEIMLTLVVCRYQKSMSHSSPSRLSKDQMASTHSFLRRAKSPLMWPRRLQRGIPILHIKVSYIPSYYREKETD